MSRRVRAAALLLALTGGSCTAVSYLDPSGPLHTFAAEGDVAAGRRPPGSLRVVTFNIAHALEIDRAIEVLRATETLRAPDVLALQEMDAPGTERIAEALGLNAVYFPSGVHPKYGRDFGCAILSPWPLEGPRKLVLPHGARVTGLRRAASIATVVRGEERIRVYSVHLPSPLAISGGSRREQLRVLAADAARVDGPVVLAGDFNSHGKVAELAAAGFLWVTRDVGDTTRFRFFGIPIAGLSYDHVLVRGLRPAPGADATGVVPDNRGASDHRPVWALLVPADEPAPRR